MKFFHLSDLHIGKHLHLYNMAEDQTYILEQIIVKAKELRPDAIVIAGDIYDKSVPSGEAYRLFDSFLNALADITPMIPVFIIAGNHDSAERLQFASSFLEKHQIYVSVLPPERENEYLQKITLQDAYGDVNFYLFPFTKPGYVRHLFAEGEVTDYESAFAKMIGRENVDTTKRNVLVAHQFFVNQGKKPETCDSEYGVSAVGGLDAIDIRVVSDFDYVALGHIHGGQTFEGGKVRYSGTLLKYSVSEEHHKKSITMVTLEEKDKLPVVEMIPIEPLRDVRRMKGTLDELIQKGISEQEDKSVHDYISVTLTDEKELYRPKDSLMELYDHLLEVNIDNTRTRAIRNNLFEELEIEKMQTPLESFREFYQMMQQQPLSEEEEGEIITILEELGGDRA